VSAPLAGRVALVTGGSRGVGCAVVRRLAQEGAAVAVNYRRDAGAAADVVARVRAEGGRAQAFPASVDDPDAVAAMVDAVQDAFGDVDLLVSNAGAASRGTTIAETPAEDDLRLMRVHALGPLDLVRRLLPGMRARVRADVVVVSSAIVDAAPARGSSYTMAKAALEAAARTLAHEERPHGVRVNIVAPGLVATDMGERLVRASTGGTLEDLAGGYPFGRIACPEDVAGVVAFLVSADAGYVTGQRILVDGGGPGGGIVHTGD